MKLSPRFTDVVKQKIDTLRPEIREEVRAHFTGIMREHRRHRPPERVVPQRPVPTVKVAPIPDSLKKKK